jgi:hypothetical protein
MAKNGPEAIKNRLDAIKNRLGGVADFSYWQCYEDPVFGKLGFREAWPLGRPRFSEVTVP